MEILQEIHTYDPNIHFIILSSQEKYTVAMQSIQKGAEQYIIKDDHSFESIAKIINSI